MTRRCRLAVLIVFIISITAGAYADGVSGVPAPSGPFTPPAIPADDHRASSSYQDYKVLANSIAVKPDDQSVFATGNVLFQTPDATIWAKQANIELRQHTGTLDQAGGVLFPYRIVRMTIRRALAPQDVAMRFTAEQVTYQQGEQRMTNTDITTCTHEHPHYDLRAHEVFVRSDGYFDAHNVTFRYNGHPVFTVGHVSTDMSGGSGIDNLARPALIIGQSSNDGFYLESNISEPIAPNTEFQTIARDGQKGVLRDGVIVEHDFTMASAYQGRLSFAVTHNDTPAGRLSENSNIAASGSSDLLVSRLPAVTAEINPIHLKGALNGSMLRASGGFGRYHEDPSNVTADRYHAWMTIRSPAHPIGDLLLLRGEAGVRGIRYGDGTGNTVGVAQLSIETPMSAPGAYADITLRHLSDTGSSPFQFDTPLASNEVFTEAELPITKKEDWHVEGWQWYDMDKKRVSRSGATLIYVTDCLSYGITFAQPLNSFSLGIRLNAFGSFRRGESILRFNP